MDVKKILPINDKPEIDCYTHYSNPLAILTNEELRGGADSVFGEMKWDFPDYCVGPEDGTYYAKDYQCKSVVEPRKSEIDDGRERLQVRLTTKGIADTRDAYLYRVVEGDGEFSVRVDSIRAISPWTNAGIMLFEEVPDDHLENLVWSRNTDMRLAKIARGDIIVNVVIDEVDDIPWTFSKNPVENPREAVWLKLVRKGNDFSFQVSPDGIHYEEHFHYVREIPKRIAIGYYCSLNDDGFYAWYYQNHIQLNCSPKLDDEGSGVPLDFFGAPRIRDLFVTENPWLYTDFLTRETILSMSSFTDFAIRSINNGYYVEPMLNEGWVPYSAAYQQFDFPHRSMLYGYDLEQRIFYALGYDQQKHFRKNVISFDDTEAAFRTLARQKDIPISQTCLYLPTAPEIDQTIRTDLIKEFLQEYIDGTNSARRFEHLVPVHKRVFGVKVYDEMQKYPIAVLSDNRISHLLWQHKKVMVGRIDFLHDTELLQPGVYEDIYEKANRCEKLALTIRNLVIKYTITGNAKLADKVVSMAEELKTIELEYLPVLIKGIIDLEIPD